MFKLPMMPWALIPSPMLPLNYALNTILMALFSLEISEAIELSRQTTALVSTGQSISDELGPADVGGAVGCF